MNGLQVLEGQHKEQRKLANMKKSLHLAMIHLPLPINCFLQMTLINLQKDK